MNLPGQVGNVHHAVGHRRRGDRSLDVAVSPDATGFRDVAFLCGINAVQHAHAVAVRRILANRDVDPPFVNTGVAITSLGPTYDSSFLLWPSVLRRSPS